MAGSNHSGINEAIWHKRLHFYVFETFDEVRKIATNWLWTFDNASQHANRQ